MTLQRIETYLKTIKAGKHVEQRPPTIVLVFRIPIPEQTLGYLIGIRLAAE
jgi:hypothetical protein